jgi:hypothetical protein
MQPQLAIEVWQMLTAEQALPPEVGGQQKLVQQSAF